MNLRLWLRILLTDAFKLHKVPGNLTNYFYLDHSIKEAFVNLHLISMHEVRLFLKVLTKIMGHSLILIVRFALRGRERERGRRDGKENK